MAPKGDYMSVYEMLFSWQEQVIKKFKDRQSFGLFLDMGLGKTPLSIAFAEQNQCQKVIVITINAKAVETINDSGSWLYWASKSSMQYDLLNKSTDGFETQFVFNTSRSEIYRILSIVRNKILDWALLLEENEIIGEGMTFTDEEKKKAQDTQIINNYTNNFYSDVSDVEMKQG